MEPDGRMKYCLCGESGDVVCGSENKIGLSPWGGVQPYDDGSLFLGGAVVSDSLFTPLCG